MANKEQWSNTSIKFNDALAEDVFGRMLEAYHERTYPFSFAATQLPQKRENLPPGLEWQSRDHAMFLFILCLWMRGGIRSDEAGIALGRVYANNPEWFNPHWVKDQSYEELLFVLKNSGLSGLSKTNAGFWIENCRRLSERWDGDPVNLLRGVVHYDEACARIKNSKSKKKPSGFMGFQEKMVSMLIYFLVDTGFAGLESFLFPVPVDIHVFRIILAHEVLTVAGAPAGENLYTDEVLKPTREFFVRYCVKHSIDPIHLSDTLWIWSRTLCGMQPGNRTRKGEGRNRSTTIYHDPVVWTKSALDSYQRSCGSCLIETSCRWNIPSAFHYIHGCTYPRTLREQPPQRQLVNIRSLAGSTLHPKKQSKKSLPKTVLPEPEVSQQQSLFPAEELRSAVA